MTRYADDFVVQCRSREEAEKALERIRQWALENGLTVHPEKTRIVEATQTGGFDFPGCHFERDMKWPGKKSLEKFKDTLRNKTRRTQGQSLEMVIAGINPVMRGWFGYFKHSHWTTFKPLDSWVRMRMRSILRKNRGGKGRGQGHDHFRWPNAYFEKLGLYSLEKARDLASQSH